MYSGLFVCEERRGTRIRKVAEVQATFQLELYLQERLPKVRSPIKDLGMIWSRGARMFLVDDVGLLFKGVLDFNGLPDVHVVFWDKIMRGRETMCRSVAQMVAEDAGAGGVFTLMPADARVVRAFAKRVGFEQVTEGRGVVVMMMLFT